MRVLVGCKRVVDYAAKVRVGSAGVELKNVKMSMNPFCEIAVEEAIRLKEAKVADEVVAVSIGPKNAQETLRTALAMGVDKAILVQTDQRTDTEIQSLAVAKILEKIFLEQECDLALLGKQSIDSDAGQTGQMLAAILSVPQAPFAASLEVQDGVATVECETDAGTETVTMGLPAVVTCDLRLNEPRYATLPNIMKAKKKPLDVVELSDMEIDASPRMVVKGAKPPPERAGGEKVETVEELIHSLKS